MPGQATCARLRRTTSARVPEPAAPPNGALRPHSGAEKGPQPEYSKEFRKLASKGQDLVNEKKWTELLAIMPEIEALPSLSRDEKKVLATWRLQAAQGQLDQARTGLNALRQGERPEERLRRETQVRAAEARLANARADFQRHARLVQAQAVSRSEYPRKAGHFMVSTS